MLLRRHTNRNKPVETPNVEEPKVEKPVETPKAKKDSKTKTK